MQNKISIVTVFAIVAMVPTLLACWFMAQLLQENWNKEQRLRVAEKEIDLVTVMSDTIHNFQLERGASTSYLFSDLPNYREKISRKRRQTDEVLQQLKTSLADLRTSGEAGYVEDNLGQFDLSISQIENVRAAVDAGSITADDVMAFYTRRNEQLLNAMTLIALNSADPWVSAQLRGYEIFLRGKDLTGQERSIGSIGILRGGLTEEEHTKIEKLQAAQKVFLELGASSVEFDLIGQLEALDASENSAHLAQLRQSIRDGGIIEVAEFEAQRQQSLALLNIDELYEDSQLMLTQAQEWWNQITNRIDSLDEMSKMLILHLSNHVSHDLAKTAVSNKTHREIALGGILASLIVTLSFGVVMRRSFSRTMGLTKRLTERKFCSDEVPTTKIRELSVLNTALESFSDTSAKALENENLDRLRRQRAEHESTMMSEFNEWLQSSRSAEELFKVIQDTMPKILPDLRGELYVYSNSRDVLDGACVWNGGTVVDHIKPGDCWGLRRGRHYAFGQGTLDFPCGHYSASDSPETPKLCIPILAHGETIGLIHLEPRRTSQTSGADAAAGEHFLNTHRRLAQRCAEQISIAVANVKLRDELQDQSIRDPLTGLFNRRYFGSVVRPWFEQSVTGGGKLSVISIDADHFKKLNDNFGHDAGDTVLQFIAETLETHCSGRDIACRFGGEEFIVVMPGNDTDEALVRAEAIRKAISGAELKHAGKILPEITVSSGIASTDGNWSSLQDMLNAADEALYAAKAKGRNKTLLNEKEASRPEKGNKHNGIKQEKTARIAV